MTPFCYSLDELQRRCAQVRAELLRSSDGRLNFGQVMSILSVYGYKPDETSNPYAPDASDEEKALALQGRRRRRWNALLCSEKIIPLWSFELVEPYLLPIQVEKLRLFNPQRHLHQAKQAVRNNEEFPIVDFDLSPDELRYSLSNARRSSVPIYRVASAYSVIFDILFTVASDEFNIFDANLEYPDGWYGDYEGKPTALRASYTFDSRPCHAPYPTPDPQRSREFWLWWIDEAVPASWHLRDL